ncbi:hypothetical protein [Streptomyces sp. NPDC021139]|uniref:hypothetical protein n=1 Tax=unclassified Streptomyces TaxID=2593676 RepID=UPI0033EF8F6B
MPGRRRRGSGSGLRLSAYPAPQRLDGGEAARRPEGGLVRADGVGAGVAEDHSGGGP